jgi:hypothetical protein
MNIFTRILRSANTVGFIVCFVLTCANNARAIEDPRLAEYVADGFDYPVTHINEGNYGFEYAQPWSTTGNAPFSTLHPGVDINTVNDCGREIKAAAGGIVTYKGHAGARWGGVILIQHRFHGPEEVANNNDYVEYTTQYAHIAPLDSIAQGDYVYRGQTIGYIAWSNDEAVLRRHGTCGNNNMPGVTNPDNFQVRWSPHLHFEVRRDEELAAANWPTLPVNLADNYHGRAVLVDDQGYFLPFDTPETESQEDNAFVWFGLNTEANNEALDRMIELFGETPYTEDDVDDPRRNNRNHILTKRQFVEVIARGLRHKLNSGDNNAIYDDFDPVEYATAQGLIDSGSSDAPEFERPVKREIAFIVASRASQIVIEGQLQNMNSCAQSSFNDIDNSSYICPYANYLYTQGVFTGRLRDEHVSPDSFARSYVTRIFTANILNELLNITVTSEDNSSWETGAYGNNEDRSERLSIAGASALRVSVEGITEDNYDYLYIYDADDNLIIRLDGDINQSFIVEGSSIRANLVTDYSVTQSGVRVSIEEVIDSADGSDGDVSNTTTWTTGPYGNYENRNQLLSIAGASALRVSVRGVTEHSYDYLYIYDANDNLITRLHGNINQSFTVPGSVIRANLITDLSVTKSGVTVSIEEFSGNTDESVSNGADTTTWATSHYGNNENRSELLSIAGASALRVSVQGVTERNYDYLYIYDGHNNLIRRLDGAIDQSFIVEGPSIRANLITDYSVTESGVTVSIEEFSGNTDESGSNGSDTTSWITGPYGNNENRSEVLSIAGAGALSVTVRGVTEDNYDYFYIYDTNNNLIRRFDGVIDQSFTVQGSSIRANLVTDYSVTQAGVTVSITAH